MASQISHLHDRGVLPDAQFILRSSVGADNLLSVLGPSQTAHLGLGVDGVEALSICGVPEFDAAVESSSSSGKKVLLPRTPSKGLDSRLVSIEDKEGGRARGGDRCEGPDVDKVVIGSRGKLCSIVTPLETTDFLGVGTKGGDNALGNANVIVDDGGVTGAASEQMGVPVHAGDTIMMTGDLSKHFLVATIPQLDGRIVESNCEGIALFDPGNRGDDVVVLGDQNFANLSAERVPKMNGCA